MIMTKMMSSMIKKAIILEERSRTKRLDVKKKMVQFSVRLIRVQYCNFSIVSLFLNQNAS